MECRDLMYALDDGRGDLVLEYKAAATAGRALA
jgi:hypothetical protein